MVREEERGYRGREEERRGDIEGGRRRGEGYRGREEEREGMESHTSETEPSI